MEFEIGCRDPRVLQHDNGWLFHMCLLVTGNNQASEKLNRPFIIDD